jgi:hypothetical protein
VLVADGKVRAGFARLSGSSALQVHLQPWRRSPFGMIPG